MEPETGAGQRAGGRHVQGPCPVAAARGEDRIAGPLGTSGWGRRGSTLSFLHSGNDVLLSFQVSKKYSEIEELYQKLSSRYPAASLPPLPRKVLFVGESDIRERRAVFNEILRCVSQDAELASSPELLEFLGT